MKRVLIFSFVALLFFSACSSSNGNKVKIGFLIHSTSSSRWQMDIAYVQERAAEVGATIVLKDALGDENLQLKQANELLEEGVDALVVVAANQNTAAGIVREAHQYKVPVIGYDRLIKNSDLDYLVSFEYDKVGQYMVDYAIQRVPRGNYVIVWGDATDANAIFVKNGIETALAPHLANGNVNVIFKTYVEGWTFENARHILNEVLDFTTEKIDVAIVCNDPMAMGVYAAFEEHGYGPNEVIITGQDATLEFVHGMLDGKMTMSVGKPIKELAYGAVDMVVELIKDNKAEGFDKVVNNGRKDVPAKLYVPYIIDKSNFENDLIGKGIFTREQVFNR